MAKAFTIAPATWWSGKLSQRYNNQAINYAPPAPDAVAAKEWSGTFKELGQKRQKIKRQIRRCLKEHRQLDKQDLTNSERIRRTQQTLDTLDKAATGIDQFLKTQSPQMGQGKRPKEVKGNITDNESAKMTTSKGTIQAYNGVAIVDKNIRSLWMLSVRLKRLLLVAWARTPHIATRS
uniref:hypothetical protein n=1 Tax=Kineobactrum salinum TaxID=2708301 RepID=UPI0018D7A717|nr:hypothetical protein [Kineobactrum salinum]